MKNTSPRLYFEMDGVLSHTPGWRVANTLELAKPARLRGTKPRVIPGAAGGVALPLRRDVTERVLNVHVYGRADADGIPYPSEIDGLAANLAFLSRAWAAVPTTADGTRQLTLYRFGSWPDAGMTAVAGPVQVLDMDWDSTEMPVAANMVVRLVLPAGELT